MASTIDMALFQKLDADCQRIILDKALHAAEHRTNLMSVLHEFFSNALPSYRRRLLMHKTTERAVETRAQCVRSLWQQKKAKGSSEWGLSDDLAPVQVLTFDRRMITHDCMLAGQDVECFTVDGVEYVCIYLLSTAC